MGSRQKRQNYLSPELRCNLQPATCNLNPEPCTLNPPFDFVLLMIGYQQDNTLLKLAGVELRGDSLNQSRW